jgi:hypothetical protein
MTLYKLYIGNTAILHDDESIYEIDMERVEGFCTTALSPVDAIAQIREAFNADELDCPEAHLEVIILSESLLSDQPVYLFNAMAWEVNGEDEERLDSV